MSDRLTAALDALRHVASLDPDHARHANGRGFARSDVSLGHRLAVSAASSLRDGPLAAKAIALAARYRRQVPSGIRYNLGLIDQPDLFE